MTPETPHAAALEAGLPGPSVRAPVARSGAAPALGWDGFEGRAWALAGLLVDSAVLVGSILLAARLTGAPGETLTAGPAVAMLAVLGIIVLARLGRRGALAGRSTRLDRLDLGREVFWAVGAGTVGALALSAVTSASDELIRVVLAAGVLSAPAIAIAQLPLDMVRTRARAAGRSGCRTLIVGTGVVGAQLEERMRTHPEFGMVPVGFLDDDPVWTGDEASAALLLGSTDDLEEAARQTRAQHVIVAFSALPDSAVLPLVTRCQRLGLDVSLVPRLYEAINDRQQTEHVGALPLVRLRQTDPSSAAFHVKHLISRVIAACALVIVAPALAGIALAIKVTSGGPVLFRQQRVGRDGQVFDMLKFRSMRDPAPGAEAVPLHLARDTAPGGVEGEDRRTPLGALLRRSSLDELPQLFNVLLGHMDLVGPRPERPELVDRLGPTIRRYDDRHRVKSGITGWAQVNGLRGQTSLSERIEWDNWYIQNWSLWLDLKILIWTPLAVLRTEAE